MPVPPKRSLPPFSSHSKKGARVWKAILKAGNVPCSE
ncbi:hypothetical protein ID866_11888 [Astraeus odoratus]|nr:hypothetical protein ID866_11888 [Astraeus odoratus]